MCDAVIDEIDGRASGSATTGWSTSPPATTSASTSIRRSWTRSTSRSAGGAPTRAGRGCWATRALYPEIEERLTELLGAPDTLVLPTITHIHMSVLPVLAGQGTSSWTGWPTRPSTTAACTPAASAPPCTASTPATRSTSPSCCAAAPAGGRAGLHGRRQQHDRQRPRPARPGRGSAGNTTRCSTSTTRTASACIGERRPTRPPRTASRGNAIVRYCGETLRQHRAGRRLLQGVLVAAGLPGPADLAEEPPQGGRAAVPLLRPVPDRVAGHACWPASTSTTSAATRIRADLYRMSDRVLDHVRALGVVTPNTRDTPVIELPLADGRGPRRRSARCCGTRGIYVTLAAYPLVPARPGRLPDPGHRRPHRRGGRRAQRRADPAVGPRRSPVRRLNHPSRRRRFLPRLIDGRFVRHRPQPGSLVGRVRAPGCQLTDRWTRHACA